MCGSGSWARSTLLTAPSARSGCSRSRRSSRRSRSGRSVRSHRRWRSGKTLREAEATFWFGQEGFVARGLFGGRLHNDAGGRTFTLTRYSLAPGVLVTGKVRLADIGPPSTYTGTVKVSGSAAVAGTLKIAKNGRITGRLGGRTVSARY